MDQQNNTGDTKYIFTCEFYTKPTDYQKREDFICYASSHAEAEKKHKLFREQEDLVVGQPPTSDDLIEEVD